MTNRGTVHRLLTALWTIIAVFCAGLFAYIVGATVGPIVPTRGQLETLLAEATVSDQQPSMEVGPQGFLPVGTTELLAALSASSLERIVNGNHSVAIAMHDLDSDWSRLQIRGLRAVFTLANVEILAVTDGEFEPTKQNADYRHIISLRPDVLITIPIDSQSSSTALREVADAGIALVFMDAVPAGFRHPQDYAGMVMSDSYANGRDSARLMADHLKNAGQVALIHWRRDMFTCNERSRAVRETLAQYPQIEIVAERQFDGLYRLSWITRRLLRRYPELKAIWVAWDTPALEVMAVIRDAKSEVVVSTVDLGHQVAVAIGAGDIAIGTGAQSPYLQGVAEGLMTLASLGGLPTPPFAVVPGQQVTVANLGAGWRRIFQTSLPDSHAPGKEN